MEAKKKKIINKGICAPTNKISNILLKTKYGEKYPKTLSEEYAQNLNLQGPQNNLEHNQAYDNAIDLKLKTLIKHLYNLKSKLEHEKKIQKGNKKNILLNEINIQKDEQININSHKKKRPIKNDGLKIAGNVTPNNKLYEQYINGESVKNVIPQLIKAIEIYKNKNIEEQRSKTCIIEKYENMLRNIKKRHIKEINEIKNYILMDVDFLIQKYRNVSFELLQISKDKENEKVREKNKITEICVNACKRFEEDVNKKAKDFVEIHTSQISKSINNINKENDNLQKKIISLKKKNEEEININQKKNLEIFQNQINDEREINEELRNQILFEKIQQNDFMKNLYSSVDSQIKNYEENIIKIFHDILLEYNINIDISTLSENINKAMDVRYKNGNANNYIITEEHDQTNGKYSFAPS
ncbi:conserved Plasmodium protein, unknown function [Plasmodium berghei]|uniref:Uncharacterized protein n=2 Tax=Plasmodium berghei TaxID=5821 RepID=A0A509AUS1_PLABA|nr:conserved protein, unknown function [Plasmodium berghei ANKA]CXI80005.1 conserved Plasmodium protein, unknown function [Plasmodium berghei]SCM25358.1 conserved Plasmodium protein, unknown function [Plasmodium berghei]SCN27343.1 conserved Plasmodium protein, unknown function [Plasmodium berghei]SCO61984.1 conserved Plasmodium protein, unknown function [Plasmodium berghei]SCO63768.1 conserved Plasmodium protein, unknown function [Plasmodium berghei]|eukprot:XP_034422977.1 conserved protein, unknown function [Plasmodium berghei ANKA]